MDNQLYNLDRDHPKTAWLKPFLLFLSLVKVRTKDNPEPAPLILFDAQKMFLSELCDALENDCHFLVCLKARQLGISTIILLLDVFWLMMHPNLTGGFIADTDENVQNFRETLVDMLDSLPEGYKVPIEKHNRYYLRLRNGSMLQYMRGGGAKNDKLGRSRALTLAHACMAPGTQVITEHGHIKFVEDVEIGDKIITHNGHHSRVIDVLGQPNTKGDMVRVHPWMGMPVDYTEEHRIPTQRGVVEARDLRKDDWLIMPLRKITPNVREITLPDNALTRKKVGAMSIGSGVAVPLSEEFGFAVGYYLAEGNLTRQSTWIKDANGSKRSIRTAEAPPSGIIFTRHEDETAYTDRVCAELKKFCTIGQTKARQGSKTVTVATYGSAFARWLEEHFGYLECKRIPDYVWTWGEDFCRGLLAGLLCGDGSKKYTLTQGYDIPKVVMPTTRSSLAMQARDLAASLGYGWGSVSYKPAGEYYGRRCKPCWRITWNGDAAKNLRRIMGCDRVYKNPGRSLTNKYRIEGDKVYIKIRSIVSGIKQPVMWDISVEHPDHTFRTASMATSNTEICRWQDAKAVDSMIDSFATTHPYRLYLFESTALGAGLWQDMYDSAVEDGITRRACFIGWWAKNTYRYERDTPQFQRWWADDPDKTDYERLVTELIKEQYGYEIEPEQWAWYRERAASRSVQSMREEMPSFAEEAFQYSGHSFFNQRALATDKALIRNHEVTFDGFAYTFGKSMLEMDVKPVKDPEDAHLKVWEYPVGRVGNAEGAKYVMGIDPSYCSNPDSDNAVIEIFRCYGDKLVQVAEFVSNNVQPNHLAWVICHLAGEYTGSTGADMMFNLEINGPGNEVARQLKDLKFQILNDAPSMREPSDTEGWLKKALEKTRWYIYRREDGIMGAGGSYHSKTTSSTKVVWLNCMRDLYSMEQLVIRSPLLLDEMRTLKQDGDDIRASGRNNDDRVMSAALAVDAYWQHVRRGMLANGRTFLAEKAREKTDGLHEPEQTIYTTMIPRYLQRRRQEMRANQIEAMRQRIIES